jgi:DNA polymerase-3 subunit chi
MKTERFDFYHLTSWPLEDALPRLMARVHGAGHRAVIMAGSEERVRVLNGLLWTYDANSWLPHGSREDGDPEAQPIWLTTDLENPNGADVLVLTDGVWPTSTEGFGRVLNLFNGRDGAVVEANRTHWKALRDLGVELRYWSQDDRGGWMEKARVEANRPKGIGAESVDRADTDQVDNGRDPLVSRGDALGGRGAESP